MRKLSLIIVFLLMSLVVGAITQPGYVRTISRPNHDSQRLDAVLIRVRGHHNPIVSTQTGDFSILMQDLRIGDSYALSAVMKSGYQLVEQDLIGRNQVGSDKIPLVISMVSTAQLQAEKSAIAAKAREGVEHYYMEQLTAIENALAEQRLTIEQYERQIAALDDKLMRSEEQIQSMADRYARTDYAMLDSVAGAIQTAIEQGDLDAAEQMIMRKGALQERRQWIETTQRDLMARMRDLKQDYYYLHTIALTRFQPDSAAYFLRLRADLDSTDVAAMLDYAQFVNEYQYDAQEAYAYVQRAERQLYSNGGKHSVLMIRALNETGVYYSRTHRLSEAIDAIIEGRNLAIELYGKNSKFVAGRQVNLGALYYMYGDYKKAKKELEQALRIYHLPEQTDSVTEAQALNNLAGIAAVKMDWAATRTYLEQAVTMLKQCAPNNNALPRMEYNLANVCTALGDHEIAVSHYESALASARRILGVYNPLTLEIANRLKTLE